MYWVLNLWISSLTDVICRSCRRTIFGTYHGASFIMSRTFFWKRSSIQMFVTYDLRATSRHLHILFVHLVEEK
jgi:hypothetical protein